MIRYSIAAALICSAALLAPVASTQAADGNKPWQVRNLLADRPVCTGKGIYAYNASWTPILQDNRPWPRYFVTAHNCVAGPVQCGPDRCTVRATACRIGAPGPWIGVTADIGKSISGVRLGVPPGSYCK